jgi:hypothetical protein
VKRKEIREEVIANGAENIANETGGEARINRWIQQVIRDICDLKPWPFLMVTKEGKAPLEVVDLAHVEAFVDVTNDNVLGPSDVGILVLRDPDLSSSGIAEVWYTEDGRTLKVFPTSATATFKVHYRRTPPALTDEEEPIIPADYHDIIVDGVRIKAYKATDNFGAAAEILKDYERRLEGMAHALLHPNYDQAKRIVRTGSGGDYL